MRRTFLLVAAATYFLVSCEESVKTTNENPVPETHQTVEEEIDETPAELAAINDESRKADGAVECMTQQYTLVQQGNFDEALKYYSEKRKEIISAQLAENPGIKKDWKAATNLSDEDFNKMIESIRKDPAFFVFEDGMWRRTDR